MRFDHVHIEGLATAFSDEVTTSEELEQQLEPLYERLRLHVGRLELMSGIRERRFFPAGTRPSSVAARAGRAALEASEVDLADIGLLIHASVCRDFMEPATASVVHAHLGLPASCQAFDLSNACLGFANAMTVAAHAIERGEISAALIVAGEDGGPLVQQTIAHLLEDDAVGKPELKAAYASLTIGSGGAAAVLTHETVSRTTHRLIGATSRAATEHHELCSGGVEDGRAGPLMDTDSEALLLAGNELARETFEAFTEEHGWTREDIDRVVTHQVGVAHKRLLFETLGLEHERDFTTVETLGNVGSVSLPATLARAVEAGFIAPGHHVCMQGIGSGLHCLMLAVEW